MTDGDTAGHKAMTKGGVDWTLGDLARAFLYAGISVAAILSFAVFSRYGFDVGLLCLLATGSLVTTSLPILLRPHASIVEPIWYIVLSVAIGVTGKPFFVLWGEPSRVEFLMRGKAPHELLFASSITVAAMLTLTLGYMAGDFRLRIPASARLSAAEWSGRRVATVAIVLTIISIVAFVIFRQQAIPQTSGLGMLSFKRWVLIPESPYLGSGGYVRWGASLVETAFYMVFAYWAARRGRLSAPMTAGVVLLGLLAVLFPIFSNSRRELVYLMFRIGVIWTLLRGELRASTSLVIAGATMVIAMFMLAVRTATGVADLQASLGLDSLINATVGSRHFLDLTKTAHVLDAFPERFGYHYGETFFRWLIAPVPRSLWPAKPAVGIGKELGPPLFGTLPTTGVPPGIIGELHLNFGLLGVFVGMLAFGVLLRSLYVSFARGFPNKSHVLVYAMLVTDIAFGVFTMDFSNTMTKSLQDLIPLLLVIYICAEVPQSAPGANPIRRGSEDGCGADHRVQRAVAGADRT